MVKARLHKYLTSTRPSHAISLLTLVMLALAWTTYVLATRQARTALENQALRDAAVYANVLEEFRALYTSEVVAIVGRQTGQPIHVSHQYREIDGAIPLPATLSMELGRRITAAGESRASLYSPHPFPWRTDGGLRDDFEKAAWKQLNETPGSPHYQFSDTEDARVLRYAVADTLKAECVDCHNTHPQTPRSGWKEGDVRGVLEVSVQVPRLTGRAAFYSSWFITPGFLIAGFILFALFRRLQRNAEVLEIEVQSRTTELADRMRRYELLFDTSPSGIAVMTDDGRCISWNPTFAHMFELTESDLGTFHFQHSIREEDKPVASALLVNVRDKSGGSMPREDPPNPAPPETGVAGPSYTDLRFKTRHDATMLGRTHARLLGPHTEAPVEIFVMVEDITAQRNAETVLLDHRDRLEREVMIQTAELRASNQELESFCRSVSHDLRAPLRALDGFSLALLEDCRDQLDDKGQDYLRRIRGGSQRMAVLIDQMLALSRVGLMTLRNAHVDLSQQAHDRIAELEAASPERVMTWKISPDLHVNGDPHLLSLVMQNLLGNAWKFTRNTPDPFISFTQELRDGTVVFAMRDNGIGWDMDKTDDIFSPFNRAPSSADFEGEGVGLATVARVITRHGGHIQAESEPGKGATFFFTLPSRDPQSQEDADG